MSAPTSISTKGLLIQYDFCTGCKACEMACKKDHELAFGDYGIKVLQYGPAKEAESGRYDFFFVPTPTNLCDLCVDRIEAGKLPACVHNCQSKVMEYGEVEELAKKMTYIPKCVLFAPGAKE